MFPSHGTPAADMTEEELDAVYERTYNEWNENPKMRVNLRLHLRQNVTTW